MPKYDKLTDVAVKNAKKRDDNKARKLADGKGLYLLINPSGSKLWKVRYRFSNIEKKLSLGSYPEISLAKARELRDAARSQLQVDNIDPGVLKNSIKRSKKIAAQKQL